MYSRAAPKRSDVTSLQRQLGEARAGGVPRLVPLDAELGTRELQLAEELLEKARAKSRDDEKVSTVCYTTVQYCAVQYCTVLRRTVLACAVLRCAAGRGAPGQGQGRSRAQEYSSSSSGSSSFVFAGAVRCGQ